MNETVAEYRQLEIACRQQAALTSHKETRAELERMAVDYRRRAEWLESQRSEATRD